MHKWWNFTNSDHTVWQPVGIILSGTFRSMILGEFECGKTPFLPFGYFVKLLKIKREYSTKIAATSKILRDIDFTLFPSLFLFLSLSSLSLSLSLFLSLSLSFLFIFFFFFLWLFLSLSLSLSLFPIVCTLFLISLSFSAFLNLSVHHYLRHSSTFLLFTRRRLVKVLTFPSIFNF